MAKKQPALPGLDKAVAKEVEDAADEYVEVRDKRSALAKKEKEASAVLIVAMRAAKLTSYRYDGHLIELEELDKLKVTNVAAEDDE